MLQDPIQSCLTLRLHSSLGSATTGRRVGLHSVPFEGLPDVVAPADLKVLPRRGGVSRVGHVRGGEPNRSPRRRRTALRSVDLGASPAADLGPEVQLRYALHKTGWNKGFDFAPETTARIALLHARVMFEIYADEEWRPSEGA